jgi:hemerythrin-like metal-binding protein
MEAKNIGQILIDNGLITPEQLKDALIRQEKEKRMIGLVILDMGFIKRQQLVDCLNEQIRDLNNIVYSLIKENISEDIESLVDYSFFDQNKDELALRTKKSWDRIKLSTKIKIIDIQHIWLIMLSHYASMLFKKMEKIEKIDEVKNILNLLFAYSNEHFSVEETLLDILSVDKQHYEQHGNFIRYFNQKLKTVDDLFEKESQNINPILNEICEFINNWILSHIAIYDNNYAVSFNHKQNKDELLEQWKNKLKQIKGTVITKRQKEFFDLIVKME